MKDEIKCPYCDKTPEWVSNEVVYGRRFGKSYMCYYCKECKSYVGCHNNTRTPLGTMAKAGLRKLRQHIHGTLDPLWKSGKYTRGKVYQMLGDAFGHPIHIGESDEEKCKEIQRTIQKLFINSK